MTTILTVAATASAALFFYEITKLVTCKTKKIDSSFKKSFKLFWRDAWSSNSAGNRTEAIFFLIAVSLAIYPFLLADFVKDASAAAHLPQATTQAFFAFAFIFLGILTKLLKTDFILFIAAMILLISGVFSIYL